MKKAILAGAATAALLCAAAADAGRLVAETADKPLSDRVANYVLDVDADPQQRRLSCSETVSWTNRGSMPVKELYFHLYPNAFKSSHTTFMREKLQDDPRFEVPDPGQIEIASITSESSQELLPGAQYVQPDDDNPDDETLLKVPLPDGVSPGATAHLQLRFAVTLPSLVRRMGIAGDFIMAGQWFPKLAVYETAGMRGRREEGWNLHQYHANSEFYADFGEYRVSVRLPEEYRVAGSGRKITERPSGGGRKEFGFYAPDVHDFAWAAAQDFVQKETTTGHGVKVKLFLDPKHGKLADRYERDAIAIMDRYDEWFGRYPYPELTIVVPSAQGKAAGSMEYPTLVTVAPAPDDNPDLNLERVMAHELAHQLWYGIVANNEFEEPWLDEGFASYAEEKAMRQLFGGRGGMDYIPYSSDFNLLKRVPWSYKNRADYVNNVYIGGKHVLQDIEAEIGEERMKQLLRTYFQRWAFKHPGTEDFIDTLEEVSGRSWHPYFAAMHAVDLPDASYVHAGDAAGGDDGPGGDESGAEEHLLAPAPDTADTTDTTATDTTDTLDTLDDADSMPA